MAMVNTLQTNKQPFYHGSKVEIRGGYLRPNRAFNSVQDRMCSGAFVTSDLDQAKFFAINTCLSGNGHTRRDGKKIYLERLSPRIKTQFHVYSVNETRDNPFIHDTGTEYYALKPIEIIGEQTFSTAEEIKKLGYEVYVLNEPLKSTANTQAGNNFDVQAEMASAIDKGAYHQIDVESVIQQQQSQNAFHRIFSLFQNG